MDILEDEFRHLKNGTMYSIIGYLKVEQGDAEAALSLLTGRRWITTTQTRYFWINMGQTYYRLVGDKKTAKTYFDKAIALKPTAIDTNYFLLSLYDIEAGDREKPSSGLENGARRFLLSAELRHSGNDRRKARRAARIVHHRPRTRSKPAYAGDLPMSHRKKRRLSARENRLFLMGF